MVNQRLQIVHFQLREAINDRAYVRIPDILTEVSGDELLQVLTRQDMYATYNEIGFYTLLGAALSSRDWQEKTKAILDAVKKKGILKEVLTYTSMYIKHCSRDEKYTITLLACALRSHDWQERTKAVLDAAKEEGILEEVLNTDMHMRLSNGTEHTVTLFEAVLDSNDWEEKTKTILKFMDKNDRANIKSRLEDQNILDKIYKIERSMATDKAMKVGGASSIIAGLIAFGGCFAAGVQLPILALVGIAVAAALAVGIVAGGITYAVLKPSNKLDEPDSNKVASVAQISYITL